MSSPTTCTRDASLNLERSGAATMFDRPTRTTQVHGRDFAIHEKMIPTKERNRVLCASIHSRESARSHHTCSISLRYSKTSGSGGPST